MGFKERNRNEEVQRSTKSSSGLRQSNTVDRSFRSFKSAPTQWTFSCLKLTIETLEQGVKYVQN